MKGQSFPLVPRDKRSFTVTAVLPNSLCVCVCVCVSAFAHSTCVCVHACICAFACLCLDNRKKKKREAEKDRKTLRRTVVIMCVYKATVYMGFFFYQGGHADRD